MKRILVTVAVMMITSNVIADRLIIATSDYETANTAVYDLADGTMQVNVLGHADQDVHVVTNGGDVYFLESGLGAISKYSAKDISHSRLVYQYSTGAMSNPVQMVFADGKAYVLCYNLGTILAVDPDAEEQNSFILREIDLSGFDDDGVPDMIDGFYRDGRLYVVLQRLENWQANSQGLIVAIDTATDTLIDLDTDTPGIQGRELLVKNPWWCSQVGDDIYVSGHLWDGSLEQGVVAVDAGDASLPQRMVISEAGIGKGVTGLSVFTSTLGVFNSTQWIQDTDTSEWREIGTAYAFDPTTGQVGNALPVPSPGGGAILNGDFINIGSRDNNHPGIYRVDVSTNELVEFLSTDLPPVSMACVRDEPLAADETMNKPESFNLQPVYPNPFNPVAHIGYFISRESDIRIDIFDATGQKVATLVDSRHIPGSYTVAWNAGNIASGMYFVRMCDGASVRSMKAMLMK